MTVAEKVLAIRKLTEIYPDAMYERSLIVVTRNRVRIRLGESSERGDV